MKPVSDMQDPASGPVILGYQYDHARALQRSRRIAAMWLWLFGCALLVLAAGEIGRVAARTVILRTDGAGINILLTLRAVFWAACAVGAWLVAIRLKKGGPRFLVLVVVAALAVEGLLGLYILMKVGHILSYDRRRSVHVMRIVLGQLSVLIVAACLLGVAVQRILLVRRFERKNEDRRPAQ